MTNKKTKKNVSRFIAVTRNSNLKKKDNVGVKLLKERRGHKKKKKIEIYFCL